MFEFERERRKFQPERVKTLFIGESPPHGGTFFYNEDSMLFRAMREAFGHEENFLAQFKAKGFFLDDLVHEPVNQLQSRFRNDMRLNGICELAIRMSEYHPSAVVALMCAIEPMVSEAMRKAKLSVPLYVTAFPGRYHRRRFIEEMAEIIPKLPQL